MLLLHIDTSGIACSVAVSENGKSIFDLTSYRKDHISHLSFYVKEVLKVTGSIFSDFDGVSIVRGPGSYTGLRAGLSYTIGLCRTIKAPVIALNLMDILHQEMQEYAEGDIYIAALDPRKQTVFSEVRGREKLTAGRYSIKKLEKLCINYKNVVVGGDGASSFSNSKIVLEEINALLSVRPAYEKALKNDYSPLSALTPIYFSPPFITKKSKT